MSKRNKRRPAEDSAAHTLDELGRESDRLAEWLTENQTLVLAAAGGVLVLAAVVGFAISARHDARRQAAIELAAIESSYRVAMGAQPDAFLIAEPANPETARQVRTEYQARFGELVETHRGDTIGALAALDQAAIEHALGETEAAIATLDGVIAAQPDSPATDFLQARRAALLEDNGRFDEAAEAWAAAASDRNPLRAELLANAARCWAEAGQTEKALAVWSTVEGLEGATRVAPYVRAQLEELAAGA